MNQPPSLLENAILKPQPINQVSFEEVEDSTFDWKKQAISTLQRYFGDIIQLEGPNTFLEFFYLLYYVTSCTDITASDKDRTQP